MLKNQIEAAIHQYRSAVELSPDDPVVLLPLARAYHAAGDYVSAKEVYEEIKRIQPDLAASNEYLLLGERARSDEAHRRSSMTDWVDP